MTKKNILGLALAAVALTAPVSILSPHAFAQAVSVNGGAIQGTITDPTGAVVSGAQITIASPSTGFKKDITTDKSGFYSIGPLNPGDYTVTIAASGFQGLTVNTVIRTGTATPGSFKLTVGSSTTEISVSAGDVQINTDQGGVSDVITKQQIDTLPINGRNFLDLAQIEPGVILQSGESFDPTKAGYSAISVGGVSGRTTRILLDGSDITDETVGTTIFNVSQGSIQEFQLNRSTQDVSGEVTSSGQVLVSTTSGTNAIHGQLFGQFQDHRALFARAENGQDPQFQRNQFGGSAGFPIIKDKLFLFGNSERIKQDSSSVSPVTQGSVAQGALFGAIQSQFPVIPSPYRETYSVIRMDYNGPFGGHYFARVNYNVNSVASNFGDGYWLYANRDNTPGLSTGADFSTGRFTHSFRGGYEKFHNLIGDQTAGNSSIYNGLPPSIAGGNGVAFYYSAQHLFSGPNYLAPQGTFQSDKQFRYDGSWTRGAHNVRYGYSINRILGGGFAAFFGLTPRISISSSSLFTGAVSANNPTGAGCGGVVGAAPCPTDPLNGYHVRTGIIGNGQGFFTENGGFNLAGGGVEDWREGAYIQDSWKITPSFTLNAGVRWSVDTDRANQDLTLPTCGDVDVASVGVNPCGSAAASTPLMSVWNPQFSAAKVHQSYGNFGPQLSFVYAPGSHKTALRGGIGIFYESDVFNNTTNARTALIKTGAFFDDKEFCAGGGAYSVAYPDGTTHTTTPNGTSINTLCNATSLLKAAPQLVALQQQYQANTKANSLSANGSYLGETLNADGAYAPNYRTPYSTQFNFGIQRELFKGGIISADYVHNGTVHISQAVDQNHIGAARYLNVAAAQNAIAVTANSYAACRTQTTSAGRVQCAIANGANIGTFAGNGLDSGNQYLAGFSSYYQLGVAPSQGAAFAGANPLLGNGSFLLPIGRSGYDALQVVFKQVAKHPAPGIQAANVQVSYNLSRIVSSSGGGSDQFFSAGSFDNDNPNEFIGRNGLDHKQEVSFGTVLTLKYGPRVGLIGHFFSASPTTLSLDTGNSTAGIFNSDITGDGTIGDVAPGTQVGDYQHRYTSGNLASYISNFNATQAGKLTPAGQALVTAGLFTQSQLVTANAVIQPISQLPQATALANPTTRFFDANFSYPIPLARFREGLSLEPSIVFYNVANLANFNNGNSGVLLNTTTAVTVADPTGKTNQQSGFLTGLNNYTTVNGNRTQRGSGTFDQGGARSTEFQLKLNF